MSSEHPGLLVIDDERAILTLTERIVTASGIEFFGAETGAGGLAELEANEDVIDIVLLDMSLPDQDGGAVFEALRERSADVPVILTSGYPAETFEHLLDAPSVRFLKKPFRPDELVDEIRLLLGH